MGSVMRTLHLRSLLALAITIPLAFLSSCRKYSGAEEKTDENNYPSVPYTLSITETRGGDTYDWSVSKGGAVTIDGTAADLYVCTDNSVVMYVRGTSSEFSGVNIQIEGGTIKATQLGKTSDGVCGFRLLYVSDGKSIVTLWNGNKQNKVSFSVSTAKTIQDASSRLYWHGFSITMKEDISSVVRGYPGDVLDLYYRVNGVTDTPAFQYGINDERFKVKNVFYPTKNEGILKITLPDITDLSSESWIKASEGENTQTLKINVKTYRFNVSAAPVTLPGIANEQIELSYELDTDIPNCEIVISPAEGSFFTAEGKTLTVTEPNVTGQNRASYLEISESSGKMPSFRVDVEQKTLSVPGRNDVVLFADAAFKSAMVSIADTNGDGEVSFVEAMVPEELVATGKGIRFLDGIEHFKRLWKVDLQDNDITDGTLLKNLPLLYWLDLKGNKELRTFDLRGCTYYFEHCEFEVNDYLEYYIYRWQYGITRVSDPDYEHSPDLPDPGETKDWSHHKKMYMVRKHTKVVNKEEMPWITVSEYPVKNQDGMVPSIVFTGLSHTDVDFEDGSWYRLINDAYDAFMRHSEIAPYIDYFDVYYLEYLVDKREKLYVDPNAPFHSEYVGERYDTFCETERELALFAYESLHGDTSAIDAYTMSPSCKYPPQLIISMDTNPITPFAGLNGYLSWQPLLIFGPFNETYSDARGFQYRYKISGTTRADHVSELFVGVPEYSINEIFSTFEHDYVSKVDLVFLWYCGIKPTYPATH